MDSCMEHALNSEAATLKRAHVASVQSENFLSTEAYLPE